MRELNKLSRWSTSPPWVISSSRDNGQKWAYISYKIFLEWYFLNDIFTLQGIYGFVKYLGYIWDQKISVWDEFCSKLWDRHSGTKFHTSWWPGNIWSTMHDIILNSNSVYYGNIKIHQTACEMWILVTEHQFICVLSSWDIMVDQHIFSRYLFYRDIFWK